VEKWVEAFDNGASDRWAYHLRQEEPTLSALPIEAIQAEIKRQLDRAESETKRLLGNGRPEAVGDVFAEHYKKYRAAMQRKKTEGQSGDQGGKTFFTEFVTLCQTASFLGRGKEA
jgi:CRISPR-associated protein Cmr2